ncbi:MAG TPA: hypothetical protein VIN07_11705 [Flavipsychrobacter sp.]
MSIAFTQEQAMDIAEDFGDLEGTGLVAETGGDTITCRIERVAIAPYPATDREDFVTNYKAGNDAEKAIAAYGGPEYDVLILARNIDDNSLIALPIRVYTQQYGVPYRYPATSHNAEKDK